MKHLLIGLMLLVFSLSSFSGIGKVTEVTGQPSEISRQKKIIIGDKNIDVESDDIVTTKGGVANITFVDDSKVKVNANSRLLIDSFIYDPKKSDASKISMKIGLGAVRFASGQIAKTNPQQVAVNTPTATVSVRGTDFTIVSDEAGRSLIVLLPSCREDQQPKQYELDENRCRTGTIVVSNLAGSVEMNLPFQATIVTSTISAPTVPRVLRTIESAVGTDMLVVMPRELESQLQQMILARRGSSMGLVARHYSYEINESGEIQQIDGIRLVDIRGEIVTTLGAVEGAVAAIITQGSNTLTGAQMNGEGSTPVKLVTPELLLRLYTLSIRTAESAEESNNTNTTSTLNGATYSSNGTSTNITVDSAAQLIASCDTISRLCITKDGQQQYESTVGLLNNGTNPVLYGTTLNISRASESYEHYASIRVPATTAPNRITLIQNDVLVSLQIGSGPDTNAVTINQRGRR